MQYIEGRAGNLDVIYKIIQGDKQHAGIILVTRETIEKQEFGDWSMAYDTPASLNEVLIGKQD
jgi:hypothetical protein